MPGEITPDLSLVVPAKNEEGSIGPLVDEIVAALAGRPEIVYEIILVDDGSDDRTWESMERAVAEHDHTRAIRLRRNFGKAAALSVGIEDASGTVIATIDADLQDDPAELPRMLDELERDHDLVTGHKAVRRDPWHKRLPSKVFNRITGLVSGLKLRDHNSGLRVARREVYDAIPLYGELHRYVPTLAHANGFRVSELTVNHRPRVHGRSKYGIERYVRGALDLLTVTSLTRFGRRPAHLFGGLGILLGMFGAGVLVYLSGIWLFTDQAIGQRPLLLLGVLLVVVGVQLVGMGLLAELLIFRTPDPKPIGVVLSLAERQANANDSALTDSTATGGS